MSWLTRIARSDLTNNSQGLGGSSGVMVNSNVGQGIIFDPKVKGRKNVRKKKLPDFSKRPGER